MLLYPNTVTRTPVINVAILTRNIHRPVVSRVAHRLDMIILGASPLLEAMFGASLSTDESDERRDAGMA